MRLHIGWLSNDLAGAVGGYPACRRDRAASAQRRRTMKYIVIVHMARDRGPLRTYLTEADSAADAVKVVDLTVVEATYCEKIEIYQVTHDRT